MCHGGWEVWVHGGTSIIYMFNLIRVWSVVSYYVCCGNYMSIYIQIIHKQCAILYKNMLFVVIDIGSLI